MFNLLHLCGLPSLAARTLNTWQVLETHLLGGRTPRTLCERGCWQMAKLKHPNIHPLCQSSCTPRGFILVPLHALPVPPVHLGLWGWSAVLLQTATDWRSGLKWQRNVWSPPRTCCVLYGCGWLRVARGLTGPTCPTIHYSFLPELWWMRIATSRISLSLFFFSVFCECKILLTTTTLHPNIFPQNVRLRHPQCFSSDIPSTPPNCVPIFASNQTTSTAFILTSMFISQAEMSGYCAIMSTSAGTWRKCVLCHKVINDQWMRGSPQKKSLSRKQNNNKFPSFLPLQLPWEISTISHFCTSVRTGNGTARVPHHTHQHTYIYIYPTRNRT